MKLKALIGLKTEVGSALDRYAGTYRVMIAENPEELSQIPQADALLIAATDETIELGRKMGVAIMAYANPKLPNQSLSGVDMIVEGMEEVDGYFLEKVYQRYHRIPWTIAETARCTIRELSLADLDQLYKLYAQEGLGRFTEPLFERQEEEDFQKAYIENMYRFYGYGMWLIFSKENGELIGRAGIEHREYDGEIEPELGYLIGPKYQRQGYASEVCEKVLEIARIMTDFPRINCLIDEQNIPSIGLAEKLGFSFMAKMEMDGRVMLRYVYNFEKTVESNG